MSISRRHFLKTCSAVSLGFLGLSQFSCEPKKSNGQSGLRPPGYGRLRPDPDGILDLCRTKGVDDCDSKSRDQPW